MVQRKVGVIVLGAALSLAGCRKAAVGITSGATVAAAVTGGLLVADADRESMRMTVGVTLLIHAIIGISVSASLAATMGESSAATAWSYPSAAGDRTPEPPSQQPPRKVGDGFVYDRTGATVGRRENGRYYDRTGASDGGIDTSGHYYDRTGATRGRVDENGHVYDATGATRGRVDENGHFYSSSGATLGRIDENGYVYDSTGASAGRVDSACDAACRREAAGRILLEK